MVQEHMVQEQLKPRKSRTFSEWLEMKGILSRNNFSFFTVPTHLMTLSCGCTRGTQDVPFRVMKQDGKLVHYKGWGQEHCVLEKLPQKKEELFIPDVTPKGFSLGCRGSHC
ncbi:MAG: hypothetical protein WCS86_01045 [Candidatus Paceibacterota bacterium]